MKFTFSKKILVSLLIACCIASNSLHAMMGKNRMLQAAKGLNISMHLAQAGAIALLGYKLQNINVESSSLEVGPKTRFCERNFI